jgi:short-subunit dehydrogenase
MAHAARPRERPAGGVVRLRLKPIDEQVIVITGASSGIGLATARLAARRGAAVVAAGRSRDALAALVRELRANGGCAIAVVADISALEDVQRIERDAVGAFGRIDTWVNNAAVSAYGSCLDVSIDDMRRIMDVNYWGTVYGSRVACAHLARAGGALVNVGSVLSNRAVPLQGPYSASKHAIRGWTDALRMEVAARGLPISITLIKPSAIATPYAEHAMNYLPHQPTHVPPVYTPRSVARAILHAASHPVREMTVGASASALRAGGILFPQATEAALARWLLPAMDSGRPRHGRPNLYEPSEDLRERGDYPGWARPSVSALVAAHRTLVGAACAAGLCAWGLGQMVSASGTARPKTRRSTVRAAQ